MQQFRAIFKFFYINENENICIKQMTKSKNIIYIRKNFSSIYACVGNQKFTFKITQYVRLKLLVLSA